MKKSFTCVLVCYVLILVSCGNDDSMPENADDPPTNTTGPVVETLASLQANDGLTVDNDGNIYASNFGVFSITGGSGTKVLKISPEGTVTDFVTGLEGPLGNAFDSEGNFYVVSGNNGTEGSVVKVDAEGNKETVATVPGWPLGLAFDANDNLFISNYFAPTVHRLNADGALSIFAEDGRLTGGAGIDVSAEGAVLVGNYNNGNIFSIDNTGTLELIATITDAVRDFGVGYITYHEGIIYATGIGNNIIYEITLDGSVTTFAGNGDNSQVDGPVLSASFKNPNGIVIDGQNDIMYVLDWGQTAIRKISLGTDNQ